MNFFQSIFSDDPQPEPQTPENPNPSIPSITSAWTFGNNFIKTLASKLKTLASKSDSVIQTYRRDLHDFTSGIKQETAVIREAAVKAVNNLPSSLDAGAGFAQNSLQSVGQAIDDLGATVTDIITHISNSLVILQHFSFLSFNYRLHQSVIALKLFEAGIHKVVIRAILDRDRQIKCARCHHAPLPSSVLLFRFEGELKISIPSFSDDEPSMIFIWDNGGGETIW